MDIRRAKSLYENYRNWLVKYAPKRCEVVKGVFTQTLHHVKTGEVDMAGPHWLPLDDNLLYVGGYLENRIIGAVDAVAAPEEMRTLHIGLDIFAPPKTKIFAPFSGRVHSFKNNNQARDYGPCIILEHEIPNGIFFTLYGHLNIDCLNGLKIGDEVFAGQEIALLGDKNENGGWPAHLHFQVILDMMGKSGDFFGLCHPSEKEFWQYICPNPYEALAIGDING